MFELCSQGGAVRVAKIRRVMDRVNDFHSRVKVRLIPIKGMKKEGLRMRRALSILFALLLVAPMFAQERTGNLMGMVTDPDGNPLPGVSVTLKGPQVGTMTQVTSPEGMFRFMGLFPGRDYQIRLELTGFKSRIEQGIIVALGKNTEITFTMELGALEEEVTVTAISPVVETKKTTLATTIPYESLQSLPSARDPSVILQMTPSIQVDRENVGGNGSGQP